MIGGKGAVISAICKGTLAEAMELILHCLEPNLPGILFLPMAHQMPGGDNLRFIDLKHLF